ncbi:Imm63 family immunity protein [Acinetobacter albensis]|uniref:Imm63 family immunity protein n=1 Tax=Acinetobacter albensis TaxID=1673609 RepID=UPI001487FCA7|nr:Imm63 family immunity protein [Acinetobacter albensis]
MEKRRVWPEVQNGGAPYVLIHENKYLYISEERGGVIFEKTTKDFEELLYWRMDNFISSYSYEFELKKALLDKLTL